MRILHRSGAGAAAHQERSIPVPPPAPSGTFPPPPAREQPPTLIYFLILEKESEDEGAAERPPPREEPPLLPPAAAAPWLCCAWLQPSRPRCPLGSGLGFNVGFILFIGFFGPSAASHLCPGRGERPRSPLGTCCVDITTVLLVSQVLPHTQPHC